jgi:dipeptide transport system ATP-binding protein
MALLEIEDLRVAFGSQQAPLIAVDGLDLSVAAGEIVGLVGESGSGKSVTALAVLGLVDYPGRVGSRRLAFDGRDLARMAPAERRSLLGGQLAMIFQDPLASLDPCYTVLHQIDEALRLHGSAAERRSAAARKARALELLRQVDIPDAPARLRAYPHQLSGGMAQRVMIAAALAGSPRLLIADEPTTALDVTVQAQVLDLLVRLAEDRGMALILITHDLAVVAQTAHRVVVMYAGQAVETGPLPAIFDAPRHPYTRALLAALPERNRGRARLQAIPGVVPGARDRPPACLLAPRCPFVRERCTREPPPFAGSHERRARCHFPLDANGRPGNDWESAPPVPGAPAVSPAVGDPAARSAATAQLRAP